MTDLSNEYIDLCRKLELAREWQQGDWWWSPGGDPDNQGWPRPMGTRLVMQDPPAYNDRPIWLPREGDWLKLLDLEDGGGVWHIHSTHRNGKPTGEWDAWQVSGEYNTLRKDWLSGKGTTLLEAFARLYMTLKGIDDGT